MSTSPMQPARIQFTGSTAAAPAGSFDDHLSDPTAERTAAALSELNPEWQLAMRAEGKAPGTIDVYTDGSRRYLGWCQSTDRAPIVRTRSRPGWRTSSTPDAHPGRCGPATWR